MFGDRGGRAVNTYHLRIGETAVVRPRWWGKSWSVIYAGVPAEGSVALVVQWSMGHNSAAYDLYLHAGEREFFTPVGRGEVLEATSREIRFRFGG
jgi:hypothetical protein